MASHRLRRGVDPGFFVVLLICLLAIWPLLSRPSLPEGTDAELHIFRLHELSYLVRGGEFYPRWAPNFYHGYGYPIFNYYAPLIYYLALPLEMLPSVDAVLASKAVLVGGILIAGLGIYGYVRDNWGRRAGFVAAALYVYSPYIQYIDPHARGALPEAFSFGVFPLALWALDRLRQRPSPGSWLAAAGLIAAVILSHNLMGLFFYGTLAGWVIWQAMWSRWEMRQASGLDGDRLKEWRALVGRLAAVMMLGLGLAAFFWLPVILERDAVTLSTLIGAGDNYDFRTHFLTVSELLAPSAQPDWGATQSPFKFNLGIAQWIMGSLGVVMWLIGRVERRAELFFHIAGAALVLFLMVLLSEPVWELIPFLPYFQFPWRLLGAAAAFLAVIGAAGVAGLARASRPVEDRDPVAASSGISRRARAISRFEGWIFAAAVALPILAALPLSQPAPWEPFGEVNTLRMSLIENSGRWLGTTSTADYVPASVIMLPARRSSVVDPIGLGLPPDRVNREAMPNGATVSAEYIRPLLTRYHVSAPKQFRLRLYQFDFPGWQVTVDGEPATTELAEPEGFIVVLVPEGDHIVDVRFGTTPARTWAWVVSAISLILVAAGIGYWRDGKSHAVALETGKLGRIDWIVVGVTGLITAVVLLLEPLGLFHAASHNNDLDIPAIEQYVNFGDQIGLLGHNVTAVTAKPGDSLELNLYWQAQRALNIDYQVFVHVLDKDGQPAIQSDKLNPGEFPTRRWPLDKYVPDTHRLELPAGMPAGEYRVVTGLWVRSEGWRLPVLDGNGVVIGDHAYLFTLTVE